MFQALIQYNKHQCEQCAVAFSCLSKSAVRDWRLLVKVDVAFVKAEIADNSLLLEQLEAAKSNR